IGRRARHLHHEGPIELSTGLRVDQRGDMKDARSTCLETSGAIETNDARRGLDGAGTADPDDTDSSRTRRRRYADDGIRTSALDHSFSGPRGLFSTSPPSGFLKMCWMFFCCAMWSTSERVK